MTTLSTETVEDRELSVRDAQRLVKGERRQRTEPVAIVGMACRFPGGAESLEDFWSLLMEGREGLSPVPEQRWRNRDFYAPPPGQYGRIYVQQSLVSAHRSMNSTQPTFAFHRPRRTRWTHSSASSLRRRGVRWRTRGFRLRR